MSSVPTEIPVAECNVVDVKERDESNVTQLCMFMPAEARLPLWAINRTAEYVQNPREYLKKHLGEETFTKRKDMLCIPESFDRDMYGTGSHKQHFEQHIAKLLGKQHGLFFITGVQAQLAALKVSSEQSGNNRVAWHVSSHLESAECQAYMYLYGLERTFLGTDPAKNPTVEEILEVLSLPGERRPKSILLEIPNRVIGCATYTFDALETIAKACREADVKLHCDGARLWEIEPYYRSSAGKSFAEIAALFDSVYVSFYKGLGGNAGAILVCDNETEINEAKIWQRRAGGNVFTLFYQVIDCERGFNQNIGAFEARWKKMSTVVERVTAATTKHTTEDGKPIISFLPSRPTCCQLLTVFQGYSVQELERARDAVREKTKIEVFARLRPTQTLDEMLKEKSTSEWARASEPKAVGDNLRNYTEWMIMSVTEKYDVQTFVDGYVALCEELLRIKK